MTMMMIDLGILDVIDDGDGDGLPLTWCPSAWWARQPSCPSETRRSKPRMCHPDLNVQICILYPDKIVKRGLYFLFLVPLCALKLRQNIPSYFYFKPWKRGYLLVFLADIFSLNVLH